MEKRKKENCVEEDYFKVCVLFFDVNQLIGSHASSRSTQIVSFNCGYLQSRSILGVSLTGSP